MSEDGHEGGRKAALGGRSGSAKMATRAAVRRRSEDGAEELATRAAVRRRSEDGAEERRWPRGRP